jgi:hypothetical protein
MLPLMGLLVIVTLHWGQFLALFGLGQEQAMLDLRLKQPPLPWLYVTVILTLVLFFEVLPYLEELGRGLLVTLRERAGRKIRPGANRSGSEGRRIDNALLYGRHAASRDRRHAQRVRLCASGA